MDLINALAGIPGIGRALPYITVAVTLAAVLASILPAPSDDAGPTYRAFYALINKMAINVGHATNLTKPLLLMLLLTGTLLVGACTPDGTQTAQRDVAIARNVAQSALNSYPIIKGMALIAAAADPALAPAISAAIAEIDPNVAKAQTALNVAGASAPVLIDLAAALTQQIQALTVVAAPAVKVVPGK